MLTDKQLDELEAMTVYEATFTTLIAQAREANALRVENAALRERLSLAVENHSHAGDPDWSKR